MERVKRPKAELDQLNMIVPSGTVVPVAARELDDTVGSEEAQVQSFEVQRKTDEQTWLGASRSAQMAQCTKQ